jgi:2-amino-4-hydroxy-6-hydroxymethyldihydropteridine diphosphokinase
MNGNPSMILVSIGANLPQAGGIYPLDTCRWAVARMDQLPNLRVRGLSRWFRTAPQPASEQAAYVNGVVHLVAHGRDSVDPSLLLTRLQAIEQAAGRTRGVPNAARTLDLDIIAVGHLVRDGADLLLPHPRAHQRGFVLVPLRDVAPGWVHPGLGWDIDRLIGALPPQEVVALAAG